MRHLFGRKFGRAMSIALAVVMLTCSMPFVGSVGFAVLDASNNYGYKTGDILKLGSYPQSQVTNETTIAELNKLDLNWTSYDYYSGDGFDGTDVTWREFLGTMKPGDFMKYADVEYNGSKYRAVRLTKYRPIDTTYEADADNSYQDDRGYELNTTYWFKFEPLEWKILDPSTGLVISNTTIDCQPFNNTVYPTSTVVNGRGLIKKEDLNTKYGCYVDKEMTSHSIFYTTSSLRKFVTETFFNTAFTPDFAEKVYDTEVDKNVNDKIYILTHDEADPKGVYTSGGWVYPYEMSDVQLKEEPTDYTKIQGLGTRTNYVNLETNYWETSTLGRRECCLLDDEKNTIPFPSLYIENGSSIVGLDNNIYPVPYQNETMWYIHNEDLLEGLLNSGTFWMVYRCHGVRPVMKLKLEYFDRCEYLGHSEKLTYKYEGTRTCTTSRWMYGYCTYCGKEVLRRELQPPYGHSDGDGDNKCDRCGISMCQENGHIPSDWVTVLPPTCTENGEQRQTCTACGEQLASQSIPATGHNYQSGAWTWNDDYTKATVQLTCVNDNCGDKQSIDADEITKEEVMQADCTNSGAVKYTATVNYNEQTFTDTTDEVTVPALGHALSDWQETKAPTCTQPGVSTRYCTRCDFEETKPIPTIEHTPSGWIIDKPADCSAEGSRHIECTVCHSVLKEEAIEMLPHTDKDGDYVCDVCGAALPMGDGCFCHSNNIFSKVIRFICTLFTRLTGVEIKCCDDMEFFNGSISSIS